MYRARTFVYRKTRKPPSKYRIFDIYSMEKHLVGRCSKFFMAALLFSCVIVLIVCTVAVVFGK